MKIELSDSELRALVLSHCYSKRRELCADLEDPGAIMPDRSASEFHRIAGQLHDFGYIEAETLLVPLERGGYEKQIRSIRISTAGVDAVERRESSSNNLDFNYVQHIVTINQPTGPVHIGDNITIIDALNLLIEKIDQSNGTAEEKTEAKSLIATVLNHPLTAAIVGALATKAVG